MRASRSSRSRRSGVRGETQPLLSTLVPSSLPPLQQNASLFARVFFTWLDPLLRTGNKQPLQASDVSPLPLTLRSEVAANLLHRHWIASGSLFFAFLRSFGWRYVPLGALLAVAHGCELVGPFVLFQLVDRIERNASPDAAQLVQWLALLFASRVLKALLFAHATAALQVVALQLASALQSIVFQKALRLSSDARKSAGDVAGVYTTDVQRIRMAAFYLHDVWVLPLVVVGAFAMLIAFVSYAALAGLGAIAVVLLATAALAHSQQRAFILVARFADERMQLVRAFVASVTAVKVRAMEHHVAARIADVRMRERAAVTHYLLLGALAIVVLWATPVVVSTATVAVYALALQQPLTTARIFATLALFRVVQEPLRALPRVAAGLAAARASRRRISTFLALDEVDPYAVAGADAHESWTAQLEAQRVAIAMENVTCAWGPKRAPLFRDLQWRVARGELAVIHGAVGSGKTSLCALLLGQLVTHRGAVFVGGAVAYCSQQPWLERRSVRDNVVFGRAFDQRKYDKVLAACGLTRDVAALPLDDRTVISAGVRGPSATPNSFHATRSQRARIALARACYSDADIFVLDAPLDAIDNATELFATCVLTLLKHKTRVLVTSNAAIVASKFVDSALRLDGSGLTHARNVSAERPELPQALVSPLVGSSSSSSHIGVQGFAARRHSRRSSSRLSAARFANEARLADATSFSHTRARGSSTDHLAQPPRVSALERRATLQDIGVYLRAVGGPRVVVFVVAVQCAWQALQLLSDFWLAHWTNVPVDEQTADAAQTNMRVYAALALGGTTLVLVRTLTVAAVGQRGARTLVDRMLAAVLRAPLSFLDTTAAAAGTGADTQPLRTASSSGNVATTSARATENAARVLESCRDDVTSIDLRVSLAFGTVLAVGFANACALLAAAAIAQYALLIVVPLLLVAMRVGAQYVAPARALQRLQRTTQAPVHTHVRDAIDGAAVIRAFGLAQTHRSITEHFAAIDAHNAIAYTSMCTGQWLALRLQLLGAVLVVAIASALVLLRASLSAGMIGLALSYALSVDQGLEPLVQSWTWLETAMEAPMRMQTLIDVTPEADDAVEDSAASVDDQWPRAGRVVFEHVAFRRSPGAALALRDVSFDVQPGENVGVVGRTGAETASLALALVRAGDLVAGRIVIDGVDTRTLRLQTLRGALAVVAPSPVLFRGSVRAYLDPFDEFADDQLWLALRHAGLSDRVAAMDGMLYAAIDDTSEHARSAIERQLLCLVRAMLAESRVVFVLDDASATVNVGDAVGDNDSNKDPAVAQLLELRQRVLCDAFERATVFIAARRLDAVLDADRILVLDAGFVAAFDAPQALLAQRSELLEELTTTTTKAAIELKETSTSTTQDDAVSDDVVATTE